MMIITVQSVFVEKSTMSAMQSSYRRESRKVHEAGNLCERYDKTGNESVQL